MDTSSNPPSDAPTADPTTAPTEPTTVPAEQTPHPAPATPEPASTTPASPDAIPVSIPDPNQAPTPEDPAATPAPPSTTQTSTTVPANVPPGTSSTPDSTSPANPQKTSTVMTVITIILLLFLPLFGLISMWVWTKWSKTVKWILTCVFLVIPLLAVLAAIALIAVNPSHQFNQADNTMRRSDVTQILGAIDQYAAGNKGSLPSEIMQLSPNTPTEFASDTPLSSMCAKLVPMYFPAIPTDPSLKSPAISTCQGTWKTGYAISRDGSNRVTISAPDATEGQVIQVTR